MNIYRRKLINAVLFFSKETRHANVTKLMKLLNFFEFEHFNQTGYPSIGLKYFAFQQGPVPKQFWLEVKDGIVPDDLKDKIIFNVKTGEYNNRKETEFSARANAQVDFSVFYSSREKDSGETGVLSTKTLRQNHVGDFPRGRKAVGNNNERKRP